MTADQVRRPVSWQFFLDALRRRKWLFLGSLLLFIAGGLVYAHLAAPVYIASANVVFESHSEGYTFDFQPGGVPSRSAFVENQIAELKTNTFAEELYADLPDRVQRLFPVVTSGSRRLSRQVAIATRIRKNLSAELVGKSDVLKVSFRADNPLLAQAISNAATELMQKRNLRVRRQGYTSRRQFIEEQIGVVADRFHRADLALSRFKTANRITSLENESSELLRRISDNEILYQNVRAEIIKKEIRLGSIRKQLESFRKHAAKTLGEVSDPIISRMKARAVQLDGRQAALRQQGLAENHPAMQQIRSEIAQNKKNLVAAALKLLDNGGMQDFVDPISQLRAYVKESGALDIELRGLRAQEAQLRETRRAYDAEVSRFPEKEETLFTLERDKRVSNAVYMKLREEREQARINEAAEIGNIRIINRAEEPRAPIWPNTLILFPASICLGSLMAFLVIAPLELWKSKPRTEEDIARITNLPLLSTIPSVPQSWFFGLGAKTTLGLMISAGKSDRILRDSYTIFWQNILPHLRSDRGTALLVTSPQAGEGKSTFAANLALTGAMRGKNTILVDADLRKLTLFHMLDTQPGYMLRQTARNHARFESSTSAHMWVGELIHKPKHRVLRALGSSPGKRNPATNGAFLSRMRLLLTRVQPADQALNVFDELFRQIIANATRVADLVIVDAPPILGFPEVLSLAPLVDATVLCIKAGVTEETMIVRAIKKLGQTRSTICGMVLNMAESSSIYGTSRGYDYAK